jgi:hypothetical protein
MKNSPKKSPQVPDKYSGKLEIQSVAKFEYPTAIGSINFKKDNIGGKLAENRNNLYDVVRASMAELVHSMEDLGRYFEDSERIYQARIQFMPIIGHIYHLYGSPEDWVSLIGPDEWDRDDYVGSFRFNGAGWERVR